MHHSVCDFLLDIVQNSVEAGSSVITADLVERDGIFSVCVGDDGKGMDDATLSRVLDPFYTDGEKHEKRSVGLGLPFLQQSSAAAGGEFEIKSEAGFGTSVFFSFDLKNLDCPPLGDIPGTVLSMMIFDGTYELVVTRTREKKNYRITRGELSEALGGINNAESLKLAKEYISSQEEDLL